MFEGSHSIIIDKLDLIDKDLLDSFYWMYRDQGLFWQYCKLISIKIDNLTIKMRGI